MSFLERLEPIISCRHEFNLEPAVCALNIIGTLGAARACHSLLSGGGILSELPSLDIIDPLERLGESIKNALRLYEEEFEQRTAHARGRSRYGGDCYGEQSGDCAGTEADPEGQQSYSSGGGSYEPSSYHWHGGGAPLGPGEQVKAQQLFDYFLEKGFTPAQTSGILGNMQTESSFRTNAYNPGEGAIGLCQWEGGRRTELESFAARQGKPVTDWRVQAEFVIHELTSSESGAFASLKRCQTPEQAAMVFQSRYERSAALTNRADNAANIYHKLHTQTV
jgi:hypothetical protein